MRFPSLQLSKRQWLPWAGSPYAQLPLLGQTWTPILLTQYLGKQGLPSWQADVGSSSAPMLGASQAAETNPVMESLSGNGLHISVLAQASFRQSQFCWLLCQHHTLTELLVLAGIPRDHLVQVPDEEGPPWARWTVVATEKDQLLLCTIPSDTYRYTEDHLSLLFSGWTVPALISLERYSSPTFPATRQSGCALMWKLVHAQKSSFL